MAFYVAISTVIVYIIIMILFQKPILKTVGANTAEAYEATAEYLYYTVIWGGIPTIGNLMLGHLIRAEGNTKQASIGMAVGGILNIILDPIFIKIMGKGAAGAGLATAISNVVAFLYLYRIIHRNKNSVLSVNIKHLHFDSSILKQIILVGLPSASVIILGASANLVLNSLMSNYGDISLAAFGIVQKLGTIAIQITVGLSQGVMPLIGFSYGSGNLKRVRELNKCTFIILAIYSVSVMLLIELGAPLILRLFTSETDTIELGISFARIWILCAPGMCFCNLFGSVFQAVGKWKEGLAIPIVRQGLLLIPLEIMLNKLMNRPGLILAQPIADTTVLILGAILYAFLLKTLKKEEAAIVAKSASLAETEE